ncbi:MULTISPECIES: hypothetical protein [unclassified Psychrobacter]|uniref:hypothetical protein n=1 Tax=unclassified Psychrobacter TaxID=196806 RepID=UPI0018F2D1BC|nr:MULTISPECIES: hypothetical protein [unclassified Psychrobacter]
MRVKTASSLLLRPARLSRSADQSARAIDVPNTNQRGASTALLLLFITAILVSAVVAAFIGHKIGYQRGYYVLQSEANKALQSSQAASSELEKLRSDNKAMTAQTEAAKQELEISLDSIKSLQKNQQEVEVEARKVAQTNAVYQAFITEEGGMPLRIVGAKITPLPENAFEYGFDVAMLSEDGQTKPLSVSLSLQNRDDFIEVPLERSRFTIEGIERIRGRFMMPKGFKPLQVKLVLKSGDETITQLYDWRLGAMVDDMPLSLIDLPEVSDDPVSDIPNQSASEKSANP